MILGYSTKFKIKEEDQRETLLKWIGCARVIWNAKISENEYHFNYCRKFVPIDKWKFFNKEKPEFILIDQTFSQFKNPELTPWLSECPSQILRNSASNWYKTQMKFLMGDCGAPKRKSRSDGGSILLTNEVFKIISYKKNILEVFIGTKTNNIGSLRIPIRRKIKSFPNSMTIRVDSYGKFTISFCYQDSVIESVSEKTYKKEYFEQIKQLSEKDLKEQVLGLDRGIKIPVATSQKNYEYSDSQKASLIRKENQIKRWQRTLARQKKGSNRRLVTKKRISRAFEVQSNIRKDFAHKTTHDLAVKSEKKVFILENLKTKNMTRSASGSVEEPGKQVAQKAGLNREILNIGWHRIENFLKYKAIKNGKLLIKVSPYKTSQECSNCEYTHEDNRPAQEVFNCVKCGFKDNADKNASKVLENRAIKLILDSGTEFSDSDVLHKSEKSAVTKRKISGLLETTRKKRKVGSLHLEASWL